jgi:hypothetical protein
MTPALGARLRHEVRPQRLAPIRDGTDLLLAKQDFGVCVGEFEGLGDGWRNVSGRRLNLGYRVRRSVPSR